MSTSQRPPGTLVDGWTLGGEVRRRTGATTYDAAHADGTKAQLTLYDGACFPSSLVLERSLRELRQLESLQSPRVVGLQASGRFEDGIFEVTQSVAGASLEEMLAGRGALPLQEAARWVVGVGEALLDAQMVGVIHRNLGASVIFADGDGVKVTGFVVGEPHGKAHGPLATMAPEQVDGNVIDQRTLVYNVAALMHWMLTGAPLYAGDESQVLAGHKDAPLPEGVHPVLQRALSKDPRSRPMMLKQFLSELATAAGVAQPAPSGTRAQPAVASTPSKPSAPTSRGWTMFMQAEEQGEAEPAKPAPAAAAPAGKPSTRGWTMFMEDDEASAPPPESASPASAPPPQEAKPSTRGWTMFMNEEGEAASESSSQSQGSAAAPGNGTAPAATPENKPSTRGWTMFMQAEDEAPASAPAGAGEAKPAAAATPAAPQAGAEAKPSTRGWTMFMNGEEAQEQAPSPTPAAPQPAAAPATAPAAPAAPSGKEGTPSSRGWTMFMEPAQQGAAQPPSVSPPAAATPKAPGVPSETPPEGSGPKKRGWTMFMDAPLPAGGGGGTDIGGPATPDPSALPTGPSAPTPSPMPSPMDGRSDRKGWTVFEPSPGAQPNQGSSAPAATGDAPPTATGAGRTVIAGEGVAPLQRPSDDADANPGTSRTAFAGAGVTPLKRPEEPERTETATSKTVVAGEGFVPLQRPPETPSNDAASGHQAKTMVAEGVHAQTRVRSEEVPAIDPNRATVRDIPPPSGAIKPVPMQPGRDAPVATSGGGSKTAIYAVAGVVGLGVVAAAAWAFLG